MITLLEMSRINMQAERHAWKHMLDVCLKPTHPEFQQYGGLGIRVYPEWCFDFNVFFQYVGPKPSVLHRLTRIDTERDFEPDNIVWALPKITEYRFGQEPDNASKIPEKVKRNRYTSEISRKLSRIYNSAYMRAKEKGLEITINSRWVKEQYDLQNGRCKITGIKLVLDGTSPYSPSLDRINSKVGYTTENTRLVCLVANYALNRFGDDVLRTLCEAYISHNTPDP